MTDIDAIVQQALRDPATMATVMRKVSATIGELQATITSLQSDLQRTRDALAFFVGAPLRYNDSIIEIPCKSYSGAMEAVRKAHAILTPPTGT